MCGGEGNNDYWLCIVLQLEMMEAFFKADGRVVLMFFYQPPTVEEGVHSIKAAEPNDSCIMNWYNFTSN